jgi:uncharacterized protein (TIGR03437 family)
MFNDPDNLLIQLGLQLPENLAGKMAISSDGSTIYALSDSGFVIIPVGSTFRSPIASPDLTTLLLVSDQCGVNSKTQRATVLNSGQSRLTATATVLQLPSTGGATPSPTTAPTVKTSQAANGPAFDFTFNPAAAVGLGTVTPPHDFLVQSPEAINIPARVRVFQNSRNAEATGTIIPITTGISATQQLEDLLYDSRRRRIYIANAGLNRVEVYDIAQQKLLAPIKTGQLPRSLALTPDGNTLYVSSAGGELIGIVDPDAMRMTGRVAFPPLPFNSTVGLVTPSAIASGQSGLLVAMSDGSLWSVVGNTAVPRGANAIIGTNAAGRPTPLTSPFSMASTPAGEYVVVLNGNGTVYLYDAKADNFVQGRQVFTGTISGYFGPITAGAGGQYYVINGVLLNQALNPVAQAPMSPIAAMSQVSATSYARFSQPVRTSTTTLPNAQPVVEMVDVTSGQARGSFPAVEGPATAVAGTGRANVEGRTMAVDAPSSTAYILTASGLSVVPVSAAPAGGLPQVFSKGVVDAISYQAKIAQNGLISVFGQNLGTLATPQTTPLPTVLGGVCVTLGTTPLPLFLTSPGQINAQIPPALAAASYALVVRAIGKNAATASQTVAISKYAPAVVVDPVSNQVAVLHADGQFVTKDNPANRDEPLTMYATGLGLPTKTGAITAGVPSPSSPLAVTQTVNVYFGNPSYQQAGIIVDFSGLAPGFIGLYQLNLRVPGFHISGDSLPVMLKIGGVSSPTAGPVLPVIAVN